LIEKLQFGMDKRQLMEILKNEYNIQTREFFYPPQTAFKKMAFYNGENFPVAEIVSDQGLYLPSGLGNTIEEFRKVVVAIRKIHANA